MPCSFSPTTSTVEHQPVPVTCVVSPPRRTVDRLREPTPPPIIRRCVKRNPTPAGDIIERVLIKKQPQTIIERITEQPRKPPPRVVERIEIEPCPPPIFRNSCVFVDPSPKCEIAPISKICLTTPYSVTNLAYTAVPAAISAAAAFNYF